MLDQALWMQDQIMQKASINERGTRHKAFKRSDIHGSGIHVTTSRAFQTCRLNEEVGTAPLVSSIAEESPGPAAELYRGTMQKDCDVRA